VSGAAGSLAKAVVYLLHGTVVALNGLSGAPSRISFTLRVSIWGVNSREGNSHPRGDAGQCPAFAWR
jgi:hypothetical protein